MRLLAEGGMGQVYEVRHVALGRRAALKVVRPDLAREEGMAERFFTEAQAMSLVEHPALVQVFEYGQLDDGGAYIVMEFVEGQTLRELLEKRAGKLPAALAVVLVRQMAAALQAAHSKGIVHRDLKPENVKIVESDESSVDTRVKIFDFGIAKVIESGQSAQRAQTRPGQIIGTPTYMAPEQAGAPGGVGPHTDVYALGVMLFESISGQPPFIAEEGIELVGKHLFAEPPRLSSLAPDVDPELDALVHRMLAKKCEDRPSMRDVKAQLGLVIKRVAILNPRLEEKPDETLEAETFVLHPSKPPAATLRVPVRRLHFVERAIDEVKRWSAQRKSRSARQLATTRLPDSTYVLRPSGSTRLYMVKRAVLAQLRNLGKIQRIILAATVALLCLLLVTTVWAILRPRPQLPTDTDVPAVEQVPRTEPQKPQPPSSSQEREAAPRQPEPLPKSKERPRASDAPRPTIKIVD